MPITLIESGDDRRVRDAAGQTVLSTVVHVTLMTLALFASSRLTRTFEQAMPEQLTITQLSFARPAARAPRAAKRTAKPGPAEGARDAASAVDPLRMSFEVLAVPVEIPDVLPEIDLLRAVTDEASFSGRGVMRGVAEGTAYDPEGAGARPAPGQPYRQFQVDRVAAVAGGCAPRFPHQLSQAGIEGSVLAEFVIDASGRAEVSSFRALASKHVLFENAVRSALRCLRFAPAEVAGRRVRQLVHQPFTFVLDR